MAPKNYRLATGALELPPPWFRSAAGLWLLALAGLAFVSLDPSYSGPDRWVMDGSMHAAIFLTLTLAPGLFLRSAGYLALAALITLSLAVGLEVAQAVHNQDHLEYGDVIANLLGMALGLALAVLIRRTVRRLRTGAERR